ncbi:MAG: hypothetical protein KatS3mg102_1565 [Planctomycetota bacterium]|nr:MAG: hypothetical protein KatS3mg102_1565 [Planctomycetota bacterium]
MERRRFRRLAIEPVSCTALQHGRLVDLSIGGAFVACEQPLPVGSVVTLRFSLPDRTAPLEVVARVQWSRSNASGRPGPRHGMGVRFVSMAPEDRLAITRHLRRAYQLKQSAERLAADLPVRLRLEDGVHPGRLAALSENCVWLATEVALEVGTPVEIEIEPGGDEPPLAVRGEVLRLDAPEPAPACEDLTPPPPPEDALVQVALASVPPGILERLRELLGG